jgi:hypothetical protein
MPAAAGILFTARMLKRIRRMGGRARMARLTPKQRSELGRKAAAARWKRGASTAIRPGAIVRPSVFAVED